MLSDQAVGGFRSLAGRPSHEHAIGDRVRFARAQRPRRYGRAARGVPC